MSSSGFAITVRLQGEVSLDFLIFVKLGITLISLSIRKSLRVSCFKLSDTEVTISDSLMLNVTASL